MGVESVMPRREDASAMTDDEAYHEPAASLAEIRQLRDALTRIAKMQGTYGWVGTYSAGAFANEIASAALAKEAGK